MLSDALRRHARFLSYRYFLPGADREDVEAEALLGLAKAIRDFRPDGGASFDSFARLCMERQVQSAVRVANQFNRRTLNEAVRDSTPTEEGELSLVDSLPAGGADPAEILSEREEALDLLRRVRDDLTPIERRALIGFANGLSYDEVGQQLGGNVTRWPDGRPRFKRMENAVLRARRKLALPPTTRKVAA